MKFITRLAFLIAFILPYGAVSADTHDDATMDVIEHSSADHYENEIELPEKEDHADGANHDKDDDSADDKEDQSHDGKEDSADDKDDSADEVEHPEKEDSSK